MLFFRQFTLGLLLLWMAWIPRPSQATPSPTEVEDTPSFSSPTCSRTDKPRKRKRKKFRRSGQTSKQTSPSRSRISQKRKQKSLRTKLSRNKHTPRNMGRKGRRVHKAGKGLSRWKQRQQEAMAKMGAFLRQAGHPRPHQFNWATYGFPEKIGPFPVERPLIPRVRMWFHVFGAYPPDATIVYDLAHFVILRAIRTPGAALLPGESALVRHAKALRRVQQAGPVFRSIQQGLRTLAEVERKAEQAEKSYWWRWWKQCSALPRDTRRSCQKQLYPKPERFRKKEWLQHFRKLDKHSREIFVTVTRSPQWKSPSWYRLFRDMKRSGLAWKTSYAAFVQKGLGIERRYRKHMHAILRQHGLPIDLAALPFVESMYNPWVRSFVDALGLWQIMPATGREVGLYISPPRWKPTFLHPIDEREDPLLATHAAARFIKLCRYFFRNSWPLAMTSYNQGPGRVLKVIKRTGTRQLHQMIQRASKRSFGPDGRNFYSKFIAAVLLRKQAHKYFPNANLPALVYQDIQLPHPLWPKTLLDVTRLSEETLVLYNPMLRHLLLRKHNNTHPIPAHFPLRLPKAQAQRLRLALQQQKATITTKKYITAHRESLRSITQRLQIPMDDLLRHNAHLGPLPNRACQKPNMLLHHHHTCGPSCNHEHHQFTRHPHFQKMAQLCSDTDKNKPLCQRARSRWQSTCHRIQRKRQWVALNQRIQANTLLRIPAVARAAPPTARLHTYRVLGNEPLSLIACRSCTTVWHLRKLNPHIHIERLRAGTELKVPQCDYARRKLFHACFRHRTEPRPRKRRWRHKRKRNR